jgi:hypothetical protein
MTPSIATISRTRYWLMAALRLFALALLFWSVAEAFHTVRVYLLNRREPGMTLIGYVGGGLIVPGARVLAGAALVWAAPRLARWLAPLPRRECPECGYAIGDGTRCPECGLDAA